jgi:hypothetical protein
VSSPKHFIVVAGTLFRRQSEVKLRKYTLIAESGLWTGHLRFCCRPLSVQ